MADEVKPSGPSPAESRWATERDQRSELAAYNALAYLISGPVLYGGLGWLLDRWLGITLFTVIGMVGGMALAIWLIMARYRVR